MVKGKSKTKNNRSQYKGTTSKHSSPTTSLEYTNTPENQYPFLNSCPMKIIESFKEGINNSLKKNTGKHVK